MDVSESFTMLLITLLGALVSLVQGATVSGASSSLCAWLGASRGCHFSSGAAAILLSSGNSSFDLELVQYTACYEKTTQSQCSDAASLCSWSSSTSGKPEFGVIL
ncbi:hypothetical protein WJX81_002886 [Elliptochloris bilobata]|uniref:Secreted protein n=1 Tax=Elliptochloris bilobata TaxID=381761 RepID=A0AAW1R1C9_9CHLO